MARDVVSKTIAYVSRPALRLIMSGSVRTRVILVYGDDILLVRNRLGSQRWSLPGGGVKKGEESKAAAKRELYEELKLSVKSTKLRKLVSGDHRMGRSKMSYKFIAYVYLTDNRDFTIKKTEILEAKWFDVNSIPHTECSPLTLHILSSYLVSTD